MRSTNGTWFRQRARYQRKHGRCMEGDKMTKQEILDRQKFEDLVCTESALPWGDKRHFARLILRHARTYQHLQEDNCNGCGTYYNEPQEQFAKRQDRFEKRVAHKEEMIERRLREIAGELGAGFA